MTLTCHVKVKKTCDTALWRVYADVNSMRQIRIVELLNAFLFKADICERQETEPFKPRESPSRGVVNRLSSKSAVRRERGIAIYARRAREPAVWKIGLCPSSFTRIAAENSTWP